MRITGRFLALVIISGTFTVLASSVLSSMSRSATPGPSGSIHGQVTADSATPTESESMTQCRAVVDSWSTQQLAAGVLMVGIPLESSIEQYRQLGAKGYAGIFLQGRSTMGLDALRERTLAAALGARSATDFAPDFSLDQEGGQVRSLKGAPFEDMPSATGQGQLKDSELSAQYQVWATHLRGAGVTINLAPVADVVEPGLVSTNEAIGIPKRYYSTDPATAGAKVSLVTDAMSRAGVAATAKHFPGLGGVVQNTDFAINVRDDQLGPDGAALEAFRVPIRYGIPLVMMSSATYPRFDADQPAMFSAPIMRDYLRGELGFEGVILSDDLGNAAAVRDVPVGQRAVRFIEAGGDWVLTVNPETGPGMRDALIDAADASSAFEVRLRDAASRILRSKAQRGIATCG